MEIVFRRVDVVLPVVDVDLVWIERSFIELMIGHLANEIRWISCSFLVGVPDVDDYELVRIFTVVAYPGQQCFLGEILG